MVPLWQQSDSMVKRAPRGILHMMTRRSSSKMRFMSVGTIASSSPSFSSCISSVGTWVPWPLKWKKRTSSGCVRLTSLFSSVCRREKWDISRQWIARCSRGWWLWYGTVRCSEQDQKSSLKYLYVGPCWLLSLRVGIQQDNDIIRLVIKQVTQ